MRTTDDTTTDLLYFTSDGLAFFDEQNARNHARKLDDDTITTMTREQAEAELEQLLDETEDDPSCDDNEIQTY
jgi:hypothetical protein